MQMLKLTILIILFAGGNIFAQLPHSFTKVAEDSMDNFISSVAVSSEGVIFAAGDSGLYAYQFSGSLFINTAYTGINSGNVYDLAVDLNGTIFLVADSGLYAYNYDGYFFSNSAYIDIQTNRIAIGSDSSIFFITDSSLFAYIYDGHSFVNTAYINIKSSGVSDIAVNSDSSVFLASDSSLYSYSFDGSSFIFTDSIHCNGSAKSVDIGSDGKIFVVTSTQNSSGIQYSNLINLYAFEYNSLSFSFIAQSCALDSLDCPADVTIKVSQKGTIFMCGSTITGNCGHSPQDQTISLGLYAYNFIGSTFTKTAYIDDWEIGASIDISLDGTLFVNGFIGNLGGCYDGIIAYTYSGATSISSELLKNPNKYVLLQNYPNPFNPTTTITYQLPVVSNVELNIYNLLGQKVATLVSEKQSIGNYKVEWDASSFTSGIYFYRLKTDKGFIQSRKLILLK